MSRVTPQSWASSLLRRAGLPDTRQNRKAIDAWALAEGGHWNNDATFNPLNTTQDAPGAHAMNGVGVKAYTSWEQGLDATVKTLRNGHYGPILRALKQGNSAVAVARAVEQTPWGTGGGVLRTLGRASGKLNGKVLGGSGASATGGSGATVRLSAPGAITEPGGTGLAGMLAQQLAAPAPPPVSMPTAPAFAAQPVMASMQPAIESGPPQPPQSNLEAALAGISGQAQPVAPAQQGRLVQLPGGGMSGSGGGLVIQKGRIRAGGGWQGSEGIVKSLVSIGGEGLKLTSAKRNNTNPYSGSRSDHDFGNRNAYAEDRSNGSQPTPEMDEYAFRVMRALGDRKYRKGEPIDTSRGVFTIRSRGRTYKVQVIYRGSGEAFGANHLNHVHVGVHRVS